MASKGRFYLTRVRMDFEGRCVMPSTPGLGGALGRRPDFTSRAAVYAIRTYGGKGGALRKGRPYPNRLMHSFLIAVVSETFVSGRARP